MKLVFCSRMEGVYGFYKGIPPYLLHVTPNICIVLLVYETIVAAAENQRKSQHAKPTEITSNDQQKLSALQEFAGKTEQSNTVESDVTSNESNHLSLLQTLLHFFKP